MVTVHMQGPSHAQHASPDRAPSLVVASGTASAQTAAAVQSPTRRHVETLASDALEGRLAGSPGEKLAADYLVKELQRIGAKPLPGQADFRMPFNFTAGSKDGGSTITVSRAGGTPQTFSDADTEVQALSFSDNGEVSGPVVFAGYGLVVPESQNFGYDSYHGPRREGQDRRRVPLLPRGRRSADARDALALLGSALQGAGGAAARRQGAAGDHGPAIAERRRSRAR